MIIKRLFLHKSKFYFRFCTMPCVAENIFLKSVSAVAPDRLVLQQLHRQDKTVVLDGHTHYLNNNVHVIGFGKAVCGMYRSVQQLMGEHIVSGVLSVPVGISNDLKLHKKSHLLPLDDGKVEIIEGANNNIADKHAFKATEKIAKLCGVAKEGDLLLVLISGGGSALLPAPIPPISIEEKTSLVQVLAGKGATIQELNVVRQQLSWLKGGKLLKLAYPAKVWSLILSDLVGDQQDLIASGPTVISNFVHADALNILERYNVKDIPQSILSVLHSADEGCAEANVVNCLVGNNQHAVNAGLQEAIANGLAAVYLSRTLHGEARELGCTLANLIVDVARYLKTCNTGLLDEIRTTLTTLSSMSHTKIEWEPFVAALRSTDRLRGICMIGAGETSVTFQQAPGQGGRNQEMVLAAAVQLHKRLKTEGSDELKISFLSAGTDGQDGPTPVAGAIVDHTDIRNLNLSKAEECLQKHDSYTFFKGGGTVVTGLTGTNVMDLQILTVTKM